MTSGEIRAARSTSPLPNFAILRGLISLTALAAAGIAGYLCFISLTNRGLPAGCGAGSGCEEVLTSRWSQIFGVPVSGPAIVIYLAITGAAILSGPKSPLAVRDAAWSMLFLLAATVLAAAAWFLGLQFFVINALCPWCLAEHTLGILIVPLIFGYALQTLAAKNSARPNPSASNNLTQITSNAGRPPTPALPREGGGGSVVAGVQQGSSSSPTQSPELGPLSAQRLISLNVIGTLLVFALAMAQIFGGYSAPAVSRLPAGKNADTGPGPNRLIAVLDGTMQLSPHELPSIGSADAPKLLVVLFDYCCPHCRATHGYLLNGMSRYPDQFGIVLLPSPLNKECNPYWEHEEARFRNACELARLALAVFRADPSAFPKYDQWLFEPETPRDPQEARNFAEELVTATALEKAMADSWVAERIAADVKAVHDSKAERIPVIMSPDIDTIVGRPESEDSLFELLETELQLRPVK